MWGGGCAPHTYAHMVWHTTSDGRLTPSLSGVGARMCPHWRSGLPGIWSNHKRPCPLLRLSFQLLLGFHSSTVFNNHTLAMPPFFSSAFKLTSEPSFSGCLSSRQRGPRQSGGQGSSGHTISSAEMVQGWGWAGSQLPSP